MVQCVLYGTVCLVLPLEAHLFLEGEINGWQQGRGSLNSFLFLNFFLVFYLYYLYLLVLNFSCLTCAKLEINLETFMN